MPSGGQGSVPGRRGRAKAAGRDEPHKEPAGIAPLYKRLPHGPHRLPRNEVIRHQRARIHGAMVEAVHRNGYERTSIKEVIGLAGVSRRSFYELFANKQECFLATFDVIAGHEIQRMENAYAASEGGLADRLSAPYEALAEQAAQNRKGATLALLEAQTAGAPGTLRLRRATTICERMLAQSFADAPDAARLPAPVVRGIAGGLHGALGSALRDQDSEQPTRSDEMLRWTLQFQTPGAASMETLLFPRVRRRMREISLASAHHAHPQMNGELARDERGRLLHQALRLAALHDYRELTAPQIADEARVPIDAFLELFVGRDDCYLAALETIGEQLLGILADRERSGGDWPAAVRLMLSDLLSYLGANPLYARTIAQEAFTAGSEAVRDTLELSEQIAARLTERAPPAPGRAFALAGIAGAILHTVRCQVVSGRIQLLGVLSDHLSYVVLAPFIGADAALAALSEELPS
jgi:AcrR family transcriptional regulator